MSIVVVCSNCSARLNAPDGAAGKKVKCPKCQTALVVPEAVASPFEVVEDEPPAEKLPAGRPARVKAAVDDDDDDRPLRKQGSKEIDDEDDEDQPRRKKRRSGDDAERGVSMTRNIVMGAVLIILLAAAAYIFYDRSQKEKEANQQQSSSNSGENAGQPDDPGGRVAPAGRGSGQDSQVVKAEWTPDPELVKELNQKREIDRYEMLLPSDVTEGTGPKDQLPPGLKEAFFGARTLPENPIGVVIVVVFEDREVIESARKNMGGFLYSQALAMQRPIDIQLDGREPAEVGLVNGLTFTRFVMTGFTPTKVAPTKFRMRGLMYGALDGGRVIMILGMRFGEKAPTETNLLETSIATFKKS